MKIAMIGQKQVPSRQGGIEVAVGALAERMAARGHDVTLYNCRRCIPFQKSGVKKHRYWNKVEIREVRVPDLRGISAALGSVLAAFRALTGGYDCIHFHAEGPALLSFLPRIFGIRTVVTIHGLDWKRRKWGGFASWYLKTGEKAAAAFASEIIVLSRQTQKYFWDTYGRKTHLIPNGIDRPTQRTADRISDRWGLKKDTYILYLGRIVPEKGLELLVQAFRQVTTDKKLVIAGDPADTKKFFRNLKQEAKSDQRILFTGFVQGEVLDELFSNCWLYCLPSELEGMPVSLLEAMSYGNCCLCSDIPECSEVLRDRGYLFDRGDVESLRENLQRLCDEPDLVEKARRQADDAFFREFSWDDVAERTLKLYGTKSPDTDRQQMRSGKIESFNGK